jgi:hypothetical protein
VTCCATFLSPSRCHSWLRHCAISWKAASSIPDGINGIFLLAESVGLHYDLGIDSVSNINEYQEYFLGVKGGRFLGLTLPPSCADCLEIGEPQPLGTLRACNSPVHGLLT